MYYQPSIFLGSVQTSPGYTIYTFLIVSLCGSKTVNFYVKSHYYTLTQGQLLNWPINNKEWFLFILDLA